MRRADAGWEHTVYLCYRLFWYFSFLFSCMFDAFVLFLICWSFEFVSSLSGVVDLQTQAWGGSRPNSVHQMGWCHISGLRASQCAFARFMSWSCSFVDPWHDIWSGGAQWHCSQVSCVDCARVGHQGNCDSLYHWNSIITEFITSLLKTHRFSQYVLP